MKKNQDCTSASLGASNSAAAATSSETGANSAAAQNSDNSVTSLNGLLAAQNSQRSNDSNELSDDDNGENFSREDEHNAYRQAIAAGRSPERPKDLLDDQAEIIARGMSTSPTLAQNNLEDNQDMADQNYDNQGAVIINANENNHHLHSADNNQLGQELNDQVNSVVVDVSDIPFFDLEAFNQQKRRKFLQQQEIELETAKVILKRAKADYESNELDLETKRVHLDYKKVELEVKKKELATKEARLELLQETKEMAISIKNYFSRKSIDIPGKK